MPKAKPAGKVATEIVLEKRSRKKNKREQAPADDPLERVLSRVSTEAPAPREEPARKPPPEEPEVPALRIAKLVTAAGRAAEISFRGQSKPIVAAVADEVETEVLSRAAQNRDAVLVEVVKGAAPVIVGVVQTRVPRDVTLKGTTVHIEAEREILLRTGRGALRIREDGDVELVGSRILAMSRGLFRIVGRMLRLN